MVGLRPGKALVQEKPLLVNCIATAAAAVGLRSPARITCGDSMVGRAASDARSTMRSYPAQRGVPAGGSERCVCAS